MRIARMWIKRLTPITASKQATDFRSPGVLALVLESRSGTVWGNIDDTR